MDRDLVSLSASFSIMAGNRYAQFWSLYLKAFPCTQLQCGIRPKGSLLLLIHILMDSFFGSNLYDVHNFFSFARYTSYPPSTTSIHNFGLSRGITNGRKLRQKRLDLGFGPCRCSSNNDLRTVHRPQLLCGGSGAFPRCGLVFPNRLLQLMPDARTCRRFHTYLRVQGLGVDIDEMEGSVETPAITLPEGLATRSFVSLIAS